MLVEPTGLVLAARRLTEALAGVTGDPVHPPLGSDPASIAAAGRLSTAAESLAGGLSALTAALVDTAVQLGLVAAGFVATDQANAQRIANLGGGGAAGLLTGSAPPAPPLPPDLRAPIPPIPAASGEAISVALHGGDPAAGQGYSASWAQVASAAHDAALTIHSVIGQMPDLLDSPNAAPAVNQTLTVYAGTFEAAGRRAGKLAAQANDYAGLRSQAGAQIPTPQDFTDANNRWQQVALANARSGGKYAVPLAQAEADLTALHTRAVSNYTTYSAGTDAATGGDPSTGADDGSGHTGPHRPGDAEDPRAGTPGHPWQGTGAAGAGGAGADAAGAADGAKAPEAQQLAQMMSSMIPAVMGAAGGLLGGLTKAPESLMQGGMQAMQQLSGMMSPKSDAKAYDPSMGDPSLSDAGRGDGGAGGSGGGEVTPMGGGPMPAGSTTPSTGPPPTPPSIPAGSGLPTPAASIGGGMGGGMPMGMPLGGMAHGGGMGGGGKGEQPPAKKIVQPPLPHTEAVTGKVSADRMAISSIGPTDHDPDDDPPGGPQSPLVRRITMPPRTAEP